MTTPSTVYFLPQSRMKDFAAWAVAIGAFRDFRERDYVALKIHFGEEGNTGYIKPAYIKPLVDTFHKLKAVPFLTDANTIYVGQRADAVNHARVAEEHGFTQAACGCPVIIADGLRGNAGVDVPVHHKHFTTVSIANAIHYADALLVLSHFKGHEISGFGGALKNIGMGCGTRAGKYAMHDQLHPQVDATACTGCGTCVRWCSSKALSLAGKKIVFTAERCTGCGECILSCPFEVFSIPWDENTSAVQEKIVEYAAGALRGKRHFSINFITHVTRFCDCYPDKGGPLIPDIGVMASADPVALDQACADIVNARYGSDFWKHIFPSIDWTVQLRYAEECGLGQRSYTLIEYTKG